MTVQSLCFQWISIYLKYITFQILNDNDFKITISHIQWVNHSSHPSEETLRLSGKAAGFSSSNEMAQKNGERHN